MILILFLYTFLFLYLLPSLLFFRMDDARLSFLTRIGLSGGIGIVLTTLASMILGLAGLPDWLLWPVGASVIAYQLYQQGIPSSWRRETRHLAALPCVVLLLGVMTQNLVLFRGGSQTVEGFVYPSLHDTMWNIAIAEQAVANFPPIHPGMSGEVLKNNHYLYPLFLASVSQLSGVPLVDIYFRYGPVIVSLLFGLSLYALSTIWIRQEWGRALAVFLGYFSGSIAYLLPLFLGRDFSWRGNSFSADQPFGQIINPYAVLGFAWYLFGSYALFRSLHELARHKIKWMMVVALFFGTLFGYKAFGGIIGIVSLGAVAAYGILRFRDITSAATTAATLLLFVPVFLLLAEPSVSSLVYAPGWLLTGMMSDLDKLNLPYYVNAYAYYQSIGNYLGMAKIVCMELLVYLIGNMGVRILGLFFLLYSFFSRPKKEMELFLAFLTVSIVVSFSIPLLFNLGANAYNIIQFTPYALVLLAVLTAVGLVRFFEWSAKKQYRVWGAVLVVLVVIAALPVNTKEIISNLEMPEDILSYQEMGALTYIREHSTDNDVILLNPPQYERSLIYVSGITGRLTYLADHTFAIQTGRNPKERMQQISDFFSPRPTDPAGFMKKNAIRYVYVFKKHENNVAAFARERNLKIQYQNEEIAVLEAK